MNKPTVVHADPDMNPVGFRDINPAYRRVFTPGELTVGLVVPIESYPRRSTPTMEQHGERVRLAESLGFSAVWLRDVPFNVPSFGDAGQIFDPFVYLGYLASQTDNIALGVSSIILSLRHPVDVAKAAHSVDLLSGGRLLLGIASGDRPEEFPAYAQAFDHRRQKFRDAYDYLRDLAKDSPCIEGPLGTTSGGMDLLPKPYGSQLPLLVTGSSQQSPDWIASNGDGWMTYPRPAALQQRLINEYRSKSESAGAPLKPVMEPLYVDLAVNPNEPPSPIHLGMRLGSNHLLTYLRSRREIGVNHVALNLRFNQRDAEETLRVLAEELLPHFPHEEWGGD